MNAEHYDIWMEKPIGMEIWAAVLSGIVLGILIQMFCEYLIKRDDLNRRFDNEIC